MSETPAELVLSGTQSRALAALARTFLAAVRNWTFYPADHPAVRAASERFWCAIGEIVDAGIGSISVTPGALLVRGRPGPGEAVIAETAALLHAHGVLEIGFDPAVPPEAPARLVAALSRPPGWAEEQGGLAEAWARDGHPAIRIEAVDYRRVLEDHERAAPKRDDVWRAIVTALASGTRVSDQAEQLRLLEIAGDPRELAALAETLVAGQCTPDGSPLVTTQAATVLASFRHLASIATVLAPDRAHEVLQNLAAALTQIDPHVGVQALSLEREGAVAGGTHPAIAGAFSEEGVAQLLAAVLALEGQVSPRLAQVFDTLVPDRGSRPHVLARARSLARARHSSDQPFDAFWSSIEQLLLSYNDQAYASSEYTATLDGAGRGSGARTAGTPVAEHDEWMATVSEDSLRGLSTVLLADLLSLETQPDRAIKVLDHLVGLADELLAAAAYEDALQALRTIGIARARDGLETPCAQALQRVGTGEGVREAAATIGDIPAEEFGALAQCGEAIGVSCLAALSGSLLDEEDTLAAERVGDICVSMGEDAVPDLVKLLDLAGAPVRRRIVALLGRIASPAAVPALQAMLRAHDPRVIQGAIRALAAIDDPAAARALRTALRTPDPRARQMVVDALVGVADRRVVPMLVRVLESSGSARADDQVVLHALEALARLGDPRSVPAISTILFLRRGFLRRCFGRRRLRTVKTAAARALILIGDATASQAIARAARTGDRLLRGAVRDAHQVQAEEGAA